MYVIARTASKNPDINGRTLYLTKIGFWSLNPEHARKFLTKSEAEAMRDDDERVEKTPCTTR